MLGGRGGGGRGKRRTRRRRAERGGWLAAEEDGKSKRVDGGRDGETCDVLFSSLKSIICRFSSTTFFFSRSTTAGAGVMLCGRVGATEEAAEERERAVEAARRERGQYVEVEKGQSRRLPRLGKAPEVTETTIGWCSRADRKEENGAQSGRRREEEPYQ